MILANITKFKANLDSLLDKIENANDILLLKWKTGKGVVMMSLEEYNSLMETMHLLKSPKNRSRLLAALDQITSGDVVPINDRKNQYIPPLPPTIEPSPQITCYNI